ncbi:MAG: glycerophosphodiester phosphodiesterase [Chloroflexota bacterium]
MPRRVLAMAHRGGEGLWPSNTLYAFRQAAALGVNALELDIHLSADGALIVRHDPVVETTCNGQGAIRDLRLAQIQALDAGWAWPYDAPPQADTPRPFRGLGIRVPTLDEVFAEFPLAIAVNIDIKSQEPQAVDALAACIRRFGRQAAVRVGSFHNLQLQRFRSLLPEAPTAAGVSETRLFYLLSRLGLGGLYRPKFQAFQVPEWSGRLHLVTPGFIRQAHRCGVEVHIWTVNETADMRRLLGWGVDGLISDYPDRLMAVLKETDGA